MEDDDDYVEYVPVAKRRAMEEQKILQRKGKVLELEEEAEKEALEYGLEERGVFLWRVVLGQRLDPLVFKGTGVFLFLLLAEYVAGARGRGCAVELCSHQLDIGFRKTC